MPQYWWFKIREARRSFFYVAARQQTSWLLFLYLVAAIATASALTGSSVPTAETIVAHMAQARAENRARFVLTSSPANTSCMVMKGKQPSPKWLPM